MGQLYKRRRSLRRPAVDRSTAQKTKALKTTTTAIVMLEKVEDDFRRGLTSEERVLLREKKKERLMKENESEHQMDEGLNLSVCKPNGGTEHPTKLEALLAKPIEDLPAAHVGQHPLD